MEELRAHKKVQQMKEYIQHGSCTTYDHCVRVAAVSQKINRFLHLRANEHALLTGAMLHDFYLYDWHEKDNGTHDWHGFIHADRAMENAKKYFDVDADVQHVIHSHMWPLNLTHLPKSRAAWIVCAADKVVSLQETLVRWK